MRFLRSLFSAVQAAPTKLVAALALAIAIVSVEASSAFAAADSVTGIDYSATGESILDSAKPAVLAGLTIMVFLLALTLGKKAWHKVSGN